MPRRWRRRVSYRRIGNICCGRLPSKKRGRPAWLLRVGRAFGRDGRGQARDCGENFQNHAARENPRKKKVTSDAIRASKPVQEPRRLQRRAPRTGEWRTRISAFVAWPTNEMKNSSVLRTCFLLQAFCISSMQNRAEDGITNRNYEVIGAGAGEHGGTPKDYWLNSARNFLHNHPQISTAFLRNNACQHIEVLLLCVQIDREEKLHESIQRRRPGQPDRCFELRREVQTARFKSKRGGEGKTESASRELDWGEKLRETRHGNAWGNLSGSSEVDRGGNFAARFRYGQG